MKKFYICLLFLLVGIVGLAQSTEVGVTEGELSVSLTGAANYKIPIKVPPGINGVVPEIGLVYNSQAGNGIAGYGWNIAGISKISRIPSTKFHDGVIDPVDFNALDRFALDGQRLIVKGGTSGAYGADRTVYETESFSNLKITSFSVHPLGAKYGPMYFVVEYPDGSKASYGNSIDSRSAMDWAINYWENPQGVRISYSYSLLYSISDIVSIKYGNIGTGTPINEIQFVYNDRQRAEQAYVGGLSLKNSRLLKEIKVIGNNEGFRNYVLGYESTYKEYQRLTSITENSGDNSKNYNPTIFTYGDLVANTFTNIPAATLDLTKIDYETMGNISGDFDGDGKTDIILYPKKTADAKKKYWLYKDISSGGLNTGIGHNIGEFEEIMPVSILEGDANTGYKFMTKQGWTAIKYNYSTNLATFSVYSSSPSSAIGIQYEKTFTFPKLIHYPEFPPHCQQTGSIIPYIQDISKTYLNGDFNGDGLTDILAIEYNFKFSFMRRCDINDDYPINTTENYTGTSYLINLDKRLTTDFVFNTGSFDVDSTSNLRVADVNGDGKADIIVIKNGLVKVYSLNNQNTFVLLFTKPDTAIVTNKIILYGDFNGDGKTDFVIPVAVGQDNWNFFMSTGVSFNKINGAIGLKYNQSEIKKYYQELINNNDWTYSLNEITYRASDFNGDGKTDILNQQNFTVESDQSGSPNPKPNGTPQMTKFQIALNTGFTESAFKFMPTVSFYYAANKVERFPIPIFANLDDRNKSFKYSLISGNTIYGLDLIWYNRFDVLLKKVTNGNKVTETISYLPLDTKSRQGQFPVYYSTSHIENYPNIDILNDPNFFVVSMLERKSATDYKKKLFQYYGAVSNVEGLGFLGFRGRMQTNWYDNDSSIISYISKNDTSLRGANIQNFTVLGMHEPLFESESQKIPDVIVKKDTYTVTSTENLVATQSITLKPNTWIKPGSTFSAKITPDAVSKSINEPSSFITKSILTYQSELLSNKTFKLKNISSKQFNGLENTSNETKTDYDEYNNPLKIKTEVKEGGTVQQTSIVDISYQNQISPYVIGRPLNKVQELTLGTEKTRTEEIYSYNAQQLLGQIKKKGDVSTNYITEDRAYDAFGNIAKRTLKAGQNSRELSYEYDASGRFLTKETDAEKLVTSYLYNPNGTLKSTTNPLGQTTSFEYDSWFRKKYETNCLGNKDEYQYVNSGGNTVVTKIFADGNVAEETYDDLGRKIKSGSKNIMGTFTYQSFLYDIHDRNFKISEPYIGSSASQWNETLYDVYGRITDQNEYTGKNTHFDYTGLNVRVNDGTMTKTYKKDAVGNVVALSDTSSNEIKYTYFANGNLKEVNYDGIKTKFLQDGWGRKTQMEDPSAGIFKYTYNDFSELTSEENKNGTTTYKLTPEGRLEGKTISGLNTKSNTTYSYNGNKLLLNTKFEDGTNTITTAYAYDTQKRISKKTETTPYAVFSKDFSYDAFGRIYTEGSTATTSGKSSAKTVKYSYKNGAPYQILDNSTNAVLWQTNTINARGQLKTAQNGPLTIINDYDAFGYNELFKFDKTTPQTNVLSLSTSFNARTGNLNNRTNSLFAWNESFKFDELDRLTEFANTNGGKETQAYDAKGRITQNNLGTYSYSKTNPYQNESIAITPDALAYYTTKPSQIIDYNVFKSPVLITEKDIDKVSFDYNDNNSRTAMFYGGLQDKKLERPIHKYYSDDGTMEIKENIVAKTYDFVTYIGGDGYTAPIVYKSDGVASQKYLYLQRDYQGSIVAITDQTGNVVEKRLFDAWGAIAKVQDGAGNLLNGLTVLDRGYTGHEHLQSVGLINMNARLYDPKLHRFLQPDNNVQDPFNPQNYNRYGYVLNNPLKYSDQSGEFWQFVAMALSVYIYGGAVTGEANPLKWNMQNLLGAFSGIGSGLATSYATGATNSYIDNYNNKPALGPSAIGPGYDINQFVDGDSEIRFSNYSNSNFNFKMANIQIARQNYVKDNVNENNNEGMALALLGYGMTKGVSVLEGSTFRIFSQQGEKFAPKLYRSGWLGGSRAQIKTYGTFKTVAGLKIGGYGLGLYNAVSIQSQYISGEIDGVQATLEHSSNAYSTFGGIYGVAWGVGWEGGRTITKLTVYQKWKQEVWLPFREETFGY